jgi:predicted component of type VI protein secretion system
MAVILQITGGPAKGRRTFLRAGQVLRIGRTERSDFDVPQDPTMAPVHFAVEYDAYVCRLRDLRSGVSTMVNGTAVVDTVLAHGDQITAGATTFSVHIEGSQPAPVARPAAVPAAAVVVTAASLKPGASGFKHVEPPTAAAVCALFELDDEAKALLNDKQTPREFLALLSKRQLFSDAVRFLGHALPKPEAVWWACRCLKAALGDNLPITDQRAIAAAEQWVAEPTEPHRRAAENAAEATKYETAAGWAAAAAFWSGGSMAPADQPEVPPKETLTPQAAFVAINLAANVNPRKAPERYAEFLAIGTKVADGQDRWPQR